MKAFDTLENLNKSPFSNDKSINEF